MTLGGVQEETFRLLGTASPEAPGKWGEAARGRILVKDGAEALPRPLLHLANKGRLVPAGRGFTGPASPATPCSLVLLQKNGGLASEGPLRGHPLCPGAQASRLGAAAPRRAARPGAARGRGAHAASRPRPGSPDRPGPGRGLTAHSALRGLPPSSGFRSTTPAARRRRGTAPRERVSFATGQLF